MSRKSFFIVLLAMVLTIGAVGSASAWMMGGMMSYIYPATSDLTWDDVNKALGVGTNLPMYNLDVTSLGAMRSSMHFSKNGTDVGGWITSVQDNNLWLSSGAMYDLTLGGWIQKSSDGKSVMAGSGPAGYRIFLQSGNPVNGVIPTHTMFMINYMGNVGIGTTTPAQNLEVNGGMRLNTAKTRPGCDANSRGTFWVTQGTSKDTVEVCVMNGSYMWIPLF